MPDPARPAPLTATEQVALDAVDEGYLVELLSELVAIPTVGGVETPGQERIAAEMRHLGLEVDEWDIDIDALATDPDYSAEVDRTEGRGVVGSWETGEPGLMLNGHIDVVPVGDPDLWNTPPWTPTIRNGAVHGRGTADMKGGLACALAAVRALRDAGVEPVRSLVIASVIGEEDGGTGTLATLLRGYGADAAIVAEPTAGVIAPSQAGALGFRLTIRGQPAHGATRLEGVSAIEKFQVVHDALRRLEKQRNDDFTDPLFVEYELPLSLSIGTLRSGEWSSTVPDKAMAEGRYGVGPQESVAEAQAALIECLRAVARSDPWLRDHPPELEWWGGQFHPAVTALDHPLLEELTACHHAVAGSAPPLRGVPYGSDLRHLVNRGRIPAVLYGPGDPRVAHQANEHVPIADLVRVARTLALIALRKRPN